jgi:hypothetical protein
MSADEVGGLDALDGNQIGDGVRQLEDTLAGTPDELKQASGDGFQPAQG